MSNFANYLRNESYKTRTENGAIAHSTTRSALVDLFALGGAYRNRTDNDIIFLFKRDICYL